MRILTAFIPNILRYCTLKPETPPLICEVGKFVSVCTTLHYILYRQESTSTWGDGTFPLLNREHMSEGGVGHYPPRRARHRGCPWAMGQSATQGCVEEILSPVGPPDLHVDHSDVIVGTGSVILPWSKPRCVPLTRSHNRQ